MSPPTPPTIRVAFIGGGLRGAQLSSYLKFTIGVVGQRFKKRGLPLPANWCISVFDKGPLAALATGASYQFTAHAGVNRDLPPATLVPGFESLESEKFAQFEQLVVNTPGYIREKYSLGAGACMLERMKEVNIPTAAMMSTQTDKDGKLDTTLAALSRSGFGQFMNEAALAAFEFCGIAGCQVIPECQTTVIRYELPSEGKHGALFVKPDDGEEHRREYEIVVDVSGIEFENSVSEEVARHAFTNHCDADAMVKYIGEMGGLEDDGSVKLDFAVGVVGPGLSGIDSSNILGTRLGCFRYDKKLPGHFGPSVAGMKLRRGQIQMLGRTPGSVPTTRFNEEAPSTKNGCFTARHNHALRLHKDYPIALAYVDIAKYETALKLGQSPIKLFPVVPKLRPSSKDQLVRDLRCIEDFLRTSKIPENATALFRRVAYLLCDGRGTEVDRDAMEKDLEARAPHTRTNFAGWPAYRSIAHGDTRDPTKDNTEAMRAFNLLMKAIAASPTVIHKGFCELAEHEVIQFSTGDAKNITWDDANKEFVFPDGTRVKALFAPKLIALGPGRVGKSILPYVKATAGKADLLHGRMLQTKDGRPIPFFDFSNANAGVNVSLTNGGRAVYGKDVIDTTTFASLQQYGLSVAADIVALGLEMASGAPEPVVSLERRRKDIGPSDAEIDDEVAGFEGDFEEADDHVHWARMLNKLRLSDEEFRRIGPIDCRDRRLVEATKLSKIVQHSMVAAAYLAFRAHPTKFNPKDRAYLDREHLDPRPHTASALLKATIEACTVKL